MINRITIRVLALAAVVVLAASGCSSSDDSTDTTEGTGSSGGATVSVLNFRFDAAEVTISAGESVTWRNDSSASHTTTAADGSWNEQLASGEETTEVFASAGTFEYFCSIHPSMTGTITVNG